MKRVAEKRECNPDTELRTIGQNGRIKEGMKIFISKTDVVRLRATNWKEGSLTKHRLLDIKSYGVEHLRLVTRFNE